MTHEDAVKDGFNELNELIDTLMVLHKFKQSGVLESQRIIISWCQVFAPDEIRKKTKKQVST